MKIRLPALIQSFALSATLVVASVSATVRAANPVEPGHIRPASTTPPAANVPVLSPGEVAATPQMWFYEQSLARYNDPKNAVRAAAEFQANQRRARIAAMQWYGYSNSRPYAGIDTVDGPLSPAWRGNGYNPNSWIAPSAPTWIIPGVASGY